MPARRTKHAKPHPGRLKLPATIRIVSPFDSVQRYRTAANTYPEWCLWPCMHVGTRLLTGDPIPLGIPITEPLDVLVKPPSWASEIRAGFQTKHGRQVVDAKFCPVVLVAPERENPEKGHFSNKRTIITIK